MRNGIKQQYDIAYPVQPSDVKQMRRVPDLDVSVNVPNQAG